MTCLSRRQFVRGSVALAGALAGMRAGAATVDPAGALQTQPPPRAPIWGITGTVTNVRELVPAATSVGTLADSGSRDALDLRRMAAWAMNYLIRSPRPEFNYEPVFQCHPYACPPMPARSDPVVACDTDARMDWEWYYMRAITRSTSGQNVERAFHERIRGYVAEDGKVWAPPGAYNEGDTKAVYTDRDKVFHIWGATKLLVSCSEEYSLTGSAQSRDMGRRIMKALRSVASDDGNGNCWFAGGMGAWKDGSWLKNGWNQQPAPIVYSLVRYYQATGDEEALAFAKAYANGMINGSQPGGIRFDANGRFGRVIGARWEPGHSHATMHAVWGVAELGLVTGDASYSRFAQRSWDWLLTRGTGTGWFPAGPDNCCETCCLSDMISVAAALGWAGNARYFDAVERYMRNHIAPLQFVITPEFTDFYRERNRGKDVDAGLASLERVQGGIIGGSGLNDYENTLLGGVSGFEMFGCCAPEGMRAIHTAWSSVIRKLGASALGGPGVYVNMALGCDSPLGEVVSFLPDEGRVTVKARVASSYFMRPPSWASRSAVRAFRNAHAVHAEWSGDYIAFSHVKPGEELTITYPIVGFDHTAGGLWASAPALQMKYKWRGNMVAQSDPPATRFPIFRGGTRILPEPPV
jgi:Beta-L-arabinofuranosidase, GH127